MPKLLCEYISTCAKSSDRISNLFHELLRILVSTVGFASLFLGNVFFAGVKLRKAFFNAAFIGRIFSDTLFRMLAPLPKSILLDRMKSVLKKDRDPVRALKISDFLKLKSKEEVSVTDLPDP